MTMNIKVYGPGCARCEQLEEKLRLALAEEGTEASVEKVTDPARIAASGILSLPGLEINGCMKCSGRVPEPAEIRYWLREATRTADQAAAASSPGCGCESGGGQAASACSCNSGAGNAHASGASCSCGGGAEANSHAASASCGCGTDNGPAAGGSCSCGSGGHAASSSCCGGKRLLTIIVLILVAIACVRLIAKQVYGDAATAPQDSATAPAAAPAQAPKAAEGAEAAKADAAPKAARVTEVVYFLYGARCVTCVNMEKWARETVEAMQPEAADLVFTVREATAGDVQKYGLQTKGVMLREWRDGRELRSFNAMELWQSVRGGEEAYKSALRRLIEAFRAENQATPSEAIPSEATPSEAPSAA